MSTWIRESVAGVREVFPEYDYTISFGLSFDGWESMDVSALDFLELHLWMEHFAPFLEEIVGLDGSDEIEYYDALEAEGSDAYAADAERWRRGVRDAVEFGVEWSEAIGLPVATTESWAVVMARDWPRLDWAGSMRSVRTGLSRPPAPVGGVGFPRATSVNRSSVACGPTESGTEQSPTTFEVRRSRCNVRFIHPS